MRTIWRVAAAVCAVAGSLCASAAEHETAIRASLTTNVGNGDFAPSYAMSNVGGVVTQPNSMLARAQAEYSLTGVGRFSFYVGADVIGGGSSDTEYGLYDAERGELHYRGVNQARVWLQQLYGTVEFRSIFLTLGMRDRGSVLVNRELSSGDLCMSGNARPMPGVAAGFGDFRDIPLTSQWLQICGEIGYFKALDSKWMENHYNYRNYNITTGYVLHYKYLHLRTNPDKPFSLTVGMQSACQIGGTSRNFFNGVQLSEISTKVGLKQILKAFIPSSGGSGGPEGDQIYYEGNHLGTWDLMGRYRFGSGDELRLYYQSPWEDGSGIGKLNGFDGMYGVEYTSVRQGLVEGAVIEYIDLMNQSGPMHWAPADFPGTPILGQATGADDYYNNYFYNGYQYYGMSLGSPMIRTAIYNTDGYPRITDNRIRGFHAAVCGHLAADVRYMAKFGYRRSHGTPFVPLSEPRSTTSMLIEGSYDFGGKLSGLSVCGKVAGDFGSLLGNNFGVMVTVGYNGRF